MSKLLVVGSLHYDIMVDAHHRPEKGETVIGTGCSFKFGGKGAIRPFLRLRRGSRWYFAAQSATMR